MISDVLNLCSERVVQFKIIILSFSTPMIIYLGGVAKLTVFGVSGYKVYVTVIIIFFFLGFISRILNYTGNLFVNLVVASKFLYFVATNGFIWYSFYLVVYGVNTIILDWSNIVLLEKIYWTPEELSLIFNSIAIELNLIDVPEEVKKKIVSSVQNPEDLRKFMVEYKKAISGYSILIYTAVFYLLALSASLVFFCFFTIPKVESLKEILPNFIGERDKSIFYIIFNLKKGFYFTASEIKFRIDLMSKNFPLVSVFKRDCSTIEDKIEELFTHLSCYSCTAYFKNFQKWYGSIRKWRGQRFFTGEGDKLGNE